MATKEIKDLQKKLDAIAKHDNKHNGGRESDEFLRVNNKLDEVITRTPWRKR